MAESLYWAYVKFIDKKGGKKGPVLLLRQTPTDYIVFRISSKYQNKPKFIQKKYIKIQDWKQSHLPKPSWIDTYQTYALPISQAKLEYIGQLTSNDLKELAKHVKL